jgi:WD40 repeat protein
VDATATATGQSAPEQAAQAPETAYDAFISYRHTEADRKWALWLHRALETYRPPRALVARGVKKRLTRVFRDDDELHASSDLNEVVFDALHKSRFLIVICSPRSAQSKWVNAEISEFLRIGRRDCILPLLIEGEPDQAFPPALRFVNEAGIADEPLAADVRNAAGLLDWAERRRALLKLLAPILGCGFDDLQQRERERTIRRRAMLATAVGALAAAGIGLTAFFVQRQVFELVAHSQDSLGNNARLSELDATRSLLLSRVAFEKSRRFAGIGGDAARKSLERALIENRLREQFDLLPDVKVPGVVDLRTSGLATIRGLAWHASGVIAAGAVHGGLAIIHGSTRDSRIKWSLATGHRIDSLAFAPGNDLQLAIGGLDPIVRIVADKKVQELSDGRKEDDVGRGIVSWCSDGHRLAITNGSKNVLILDPTNGADPVEIISEDPRSINTVAWNRDCSALAMGGEFDSYVWSKGTDTPRKLGVQGPKSVNAPINPGRGTLAVAWYKDGSKFASAGGNGAIIVTTRSPFDTTSAFDTAESALLGSHDQPVLGLAWGGPHGSQLASAGLDGTVRIWTEKYFSYGYPQQTILTNQLGSWSVAWSPDGKQIATGGGDGTVKIWWVSDEPEPVQINGVTGTLTVSEIPDDKSASRSLLFNGRPLDDTQLSDLARQRSTRSLTLDECKRYLQANSCPVLP